MLGEQAGTDEGTQKLARNLRTLSERGAATSAVEMDGFVAERPALPEMGRHPSGCLGCQPPHKPRNEFEAVGGFGFGCNTARDGRSRRCPACPPARAEAACRDWRV